MADAVSRFTPTTLLAYLDSLGIAHHTVCHEAVFTVTEARTVRGELPGGHSKNLFLRNKKGKMWLVTCEESRHIDLRLLATRLSAGRFSFASSERLERYLGVTPGAVTPFSVINDTERCVTMVLDVSLMAESLLNFHPLVNTQTTAITPTDLVRFLEAVNHPPQILEL